jgi:hypothetical protein
VRRLRQLRLQPKHVRQITEIRNAIEALSESNETLHIVSQDIIEQKDIIGK